eukprot:TRINITY_DN110093_c0_g1_i1.p1 TRINITY_DN110093_c0_g1~~TRINITY_DN110093_c0_g1_i1.p1  ORF type:complete len:109 (+),score=21.49 TRINITY_DN110093_c0_g1_i1:101-427(+)
MSDVLATGKHLIHQEKPYVVCERPDIEKEDYRKLGRAQEQLENICKGRTDKKMTVVPEMRFKSMYVEIEGEDRPRWVISVEKEKVQVNQRNLLFLGTSQEQLLAGRGD